MEQKNFKEGVFLRRPERKRAGTHGVGKSPKKSHFTTLRAKRATFTFPSSTYFKGPNSVTRQVYFNRTKIGKNAKK